MIAGLQVLNDSNTMQVDQDYRNLVLISTQTYNATHGSVTGDVAYVTINVTGDIAMVAVASSQYMPALVASSKTGSTWSYKYGIYYDSAYAPGSVITFYVFGEAAVSGLTNVGLEVFRGDGVRVYHTDTKPLRIVSVEPANTNYTGPSGRTIVPLILRQFVRADFVPLLSKYIDITTALRCSGNAIWNAEVSVSQGFVGYSNVGAYAAVDVTGY